MPQGEMASASVRGVGVVIKSTLNKNELGFLAPFAASPYQMNFFLTANTEKVIVLHSPLMATKQARHWKIKQSPLVTVFWWLAHKTLSNTCQTS